MDGKMKTAVMPKLGVLEFVQRDIPKPKADQVLVRMEYVGICGSDLHIYDGSFAEELPFVMGHESAGVVVEVGADVSGLKPGDKVALEPGITCRSCEMCRTGRYNLCPKVEFFAAAGIDGVFMEYVAHDANMCFKLPDNMTTLEGAMIEPLAVGYHAALLGGARIGMSAVVTGAGCIGLVSMLALRSMGVSNIIITDVLQKRLDKAAELGANHVINASETDVTAKVMELTGGGGADLIIETAGSQASTQQALHMAKKGSTISLVGYSSTGRMELPVSLILDKELTLKGVFRYRNIYPMAISAVAAGNVDVKNVVSHMFKFDDIQNAFDRSMNEKADIIKAVIEF